MVELYCELIIGYNPRRGPTSSTPRRSRPSARARPRRLGTLSAFHSESVLCGGFVWEHRALNSPKRRFLPRAGGPKKQERINARVAYIEGAMTAIEKEDWDKKMASAPEELSTADKAEFVAGLKGVAISSDAFFPFRDSIDVASQVCVSPMPRCCCSFLCAAACVCCCAPPLSILRCLGVHHRCLCCSVLHLCLLSYHV